MEHMIKTYLLWINDWSDTMLLALALLFKLGAVFSLKFPA
jgi:hypothetical protein